MRVGEGLFGLNVSSDPKNFRFGISVCHDQDALEYGVCVFVQPKNQSYDQHGLLEYCLPNPEDLGFYEAMECVYEYCPKGDPDPSLREEVIKVLTEHGLTYDPDLGNLSKEEQERNAKSLCEMLKPILEKFKQEKT